MERVNDAMHGHRDVLTASPTNRHPPAPSGPLDHTMPRLPVMASPRLAGPKLPLVSLVQRRDVDGPSLLAAPPLSRPRKLAPRRPGP